MYSVNKPGVQVVGTILLELCFVLNPFNFSPDDKLTISERFQ